MSKGAKGQQPNVFVQAFTENIKIDAVHVNLTQECIMITEDKAFRCLNEWKSKLENGKAWTAPVSLFVPLSLALVATTFKDAFGIDKATWQALFILGVAGAAIWTLYGFIVAYRSRGNRTVEALIDQLKKGAVIQRTNPVPLAEPAISPLNPVSQPQPGQSEKPR